MKKANLKEVKTLEIKDLQGRIKKAKEDLAGIVMEKSESTKGAKDVKTFFKERKDIAQMMTILRQKELLSELESKDRSHLRGGVENEASSHLGGGHKEAKV